MRDVNRALITKLAWSMSVDGHKPWVQLIWYLRGRKLLDVQGTERFVSWVWGSIKRCMNNLCIGAWYQI